MLTTSTGKTSHCPARLHTGMEDTPKLDGEVFVRQDAVYLLDCLLLGDVVDMEEDLAKLVTNTIPPWGMQQRKINLACTPNKH